MLLKKYQGMKGIASHRLKKHKHGKGKMKLIKIKDTYLAPKSGFIFLSRSGAKNCILCI